MTIVLKAYSFILFHSIQEYLYNHDTLKWIKITKLKWKYPDTHESWHSGINIYCYQQPFHQTVPSITSLQASAMTIWHSSQILTIWISQWRELELHYSHQISIDLDIQCFPKQHKENQPTTVTNLMLYTDKCVHN